MLEQLIAEILEQDKNNVAEKALIAILEARLHKFNCAYSLLVDAYDLNDTQDEKKIYFAMLEALVVKIHTIENELNELNDMH